MNPVGVNRSQMKDQFTGPISFSANQDKAESQGCRRRISMATTSTKFAAMSR